MASYFDWTADADKAFLPPEYRDASELQNVAAIAEADVIEFFTEYTGDTAYKVVSTVREQTDIADSDYMTVFLRGYEEDADDADVDPGLKRAMKKTIAEVIRWRMDKWKESAGLESETDDRGTTRTMMTEFLRGAFPPGWKRWLRPFDSSERAWGV
jgi:hypothetical protein